jgi:hypothetical protein
MPANRSNPPRKIISAVFSYDSLASPIIPIPSLKDVVRYYKKSNRKNRIIKVKDINGYHQFFVNLFKIRGGADTISAP